MTEPRTPLNFGDEFIESTPPTAAGRFAVEEDALGVLLSSGHRFSWEDNSFGEIIKIINAAHEKAVQEAVKAEREWCAKICDKIEELYECGECCNSFNCAKAIRARPTEGK